MGVSVCMWGCECVCVYESVWVCACLGACLCAYVPRCPTYSEIIVYDARTHMVYNMDMQTWRLV